jgi:hypothetical protein
MKQQEGDDEMNAADDFFNAYPECIKHDEDHSEDEEEEEEKDLKNAAQLVLPVSMEPQQVECSGPPPGTTDSATKSMLTHRQSPRPHNPYAAPRQHPTCLKSREEPKSIHHAQTNKMYNKPIIRTIPLSMLLLSNSSWEVVSNMHNQHIMPRPCSRQQ